VAYCTIQEMNVIYLSFCWGDVNSIVGGLIFCITHCFLSLMMFYLVDCIQRRFGSRSITELSGILQITPNLGITIIVMCVLYSGVPGTLKFISEFYIFSGLFEIAPLSSCFLLFMVNVVGLVGFSKPWFNITFGMCTKNGVSVPTDLSYKECLVLYICAFFLVFSSFITCNVF
jgi:formate hydrogenlyase subunit 3/multisubunit Na+/H+ antiporter MnhD subunit